ncbi:zinc carboxypeptidase [Teladorsagia circumcincta]|uniref:Zinc carboxypeptidase n=1 Tax=Teladorsagia circumcincta TaxID=45464 RepID=A0A2G9U916_TELCI|nr:zinc carboxypeptidase [Teladorsagia circumcincta]
MLLNVNSEQIDYLRAVRSPKQPADMLLEDEDLAYVQRFLTRKGILNEVVLRNVEREVRRERRALIGSVGEEITLDTIQKKYLSFDDLLHDSSYKRLLHEMDVVVVPNTNPDGYEYSREVMGLAAAILERRNEIRGYIALHSFGQDILYPWGHKVNEYPPDVEDLKPTLQKSMANGIAAAIYSVYGTRYLVSNSAAGLYPASGAADDWAKSIGVKYSFTFELSPTTMEPGFLLPEAHIPQVTRETMEGVVYMARRIRSEEVGRLLNDIISSRPIRRRSQRRIG